MPMGLTGKTAYKLAYKDIDERIVKLKDISASLLDLALILDGFCDSKGGSKDALSDDFYQLAEAGFALHQALESLAEDIDKGKTKFKETDENLAAYYMLL
ncbi:MAG: hypothetical protein K6D38_09195 [Pseudobutyrivibrio sp.]|nr:hypothetical protein [Pseudobutyrivibrio sp.]